MSVDDKPSILEDDLDEIEAKIHPSDEDGDEDSSSDEIQEDDQPGGATEEEEEFQAAAAVKNHLTVEEVEALQVEAKAKGYGKLYAAMGGGEEGLEACIAVEALCEVSMYLLKYVVSEISYIDSMYLCHCISLSLAYQSTNCRSLPAGQRH